MSRRPRRAPGWTGSGRWAGRSAPGGGSPGLHLRATDTDWERSATAPLVEGPALALLLLLTGRTRTAQEMLTGSGVNRLG